MPTHAAIKATFDLLVVTAVTGARCPENRARDDAGIAPDYLRELCYSGHVRVEISGRNYRQVFILVGPHKGKSTAPNPNGSKVWRIVDADGGRIITGRPLMRQPPAPQLLPYASKVG
jgi:hypothetical protein